MENGILSDRQIAELCATENMISPFADRQVRVNEAGEPIISYGLSSYGYDLRLGREFKIFTNAHQGQGVVDPKNFDMKNYVEHEGDSVIIPPGGFLLGHSVEYIRMPANLTGVVLGKSTYARCGCICLATPLEAGWEGQVTLEFANNTPLPLKMYAHEGSAQVLFFSGAPCKVSYADRAGKYQHQRGVTLASV